MAKVVALANVIMPTKNTEPMEPDTVRKEVSSDEASGTVRGAWVPAGHTGAGSVVYAGKVDVLTVSGTANSVTWTGATPDVRDTGVSNILRAG